MKLKELVKELNNNKIIKALINAHDEMTGEQLAIKLNDNERPWGYRVSLEIGDGLNDFQITESWEFFNKKEYENYMPVISDERVKELTNKTIRIIVLLLLEMTE